MEFQAEATSYLTMNELLLTASWWDRNAAEVGLAGLVVTVLGVALGVAFFLMQRDKKTFDWMLLTNEAIVTSVPAKAVGGITVYMDGTTQLQEPRLLTIRFTNTGKKEVRPEDFDGDITIKPRPYLVIRSAKAVRRKSGMRHLPQVAFDDQECIVAPILYNRGDWVDVQLLVDTLAPSDSSPAQRGRRDAAEAAARYMARYLVRDGTSAALLTDGGGEDPVAVECVIAGQTRPTRKVDIFAAAKRWNSLVTVLLAVVAAALSVVVLIF